MERATQARRNGPDRPTGTDRREVNLIDEQPARRDAGGIVERLLRIHSA
jgi:hypothetical protein